MARLGLDHLALTRRGLLLGAGAALALRPARATDLAGLETRWLATAGVDGGFSAVGLDSTLAAIEQAPSAARLHGIEASPRGPLAVAVGRRPGHVALVFDREKGGTVATFSPGAGRVFSGHGRFTADGTRFLTNEIERPQDGAHGMGRGVVALREAKDDFPIIAEWPSGGDGPHDLMQSGAVLVIANGGIEPNTPEARDAEVTGSGVTLLDPATGSTRGSGQLAADLASLSLRHLARDGQGHTVVAAQDLLKDGEARPLLFGIAGDGALSPFDAPEQEWRALRGYVGSVAYDPSGRFVACASPRGNRVAVWQASGRYLGAVPLTDGCGLAAGRDPGTFVAASGYGEVIMVAATADGLAVVARHTGGPRFDNHMVRIG